MHLVLTLILTMQMEFRSTQSVHYYPLSCFIGFLCLVCRMMSIYQSLPWTPECLFYSLSDFDQDIGRRRSDNLFGQGY